MRPPRLRFASAHGQSLVETALLLPPLLLLLLNALNFSYYFLVALNLAAAPRAAVLYSISGTDSAANSSLPADGPTSTDTSVSYLALNDLNGALAGALASSGNPMTKVQVCSASKGTSGTGATQTAQCDQYNGFTAITPDSDPEAPTYVLNRVDVDYIFKPLIPGAPFNLVTLGSSACTASGTCTFHRFAEMRAMN